MALAFACGHAAQGIRVLPQNAQGADHLSLFCESRPPIAHLCRLKIISSHLEMHPFADEIRLVARLRGYARLDLLGPRGQQTRARMRSLLGLPLRKRLPNARPA